MMEQLRAAIPQPVWRVLVRVGRFVRLWWIDLMVLYLALAYLIAPPFHTPQDMWLRMFLPMGVGLMLLLLCHLPNLRALHKGWRFTGSRAEAVCLTKELHAEKACIAPDIAVIQVTMPDVGAADLTLRADTSSLLLSTAAALTLPMHPEACQPELEARLAAIAMQPDRVAARWKPLGTAEIFGFPAVIVRDGMKERYFLTGDVSVLLPRCTHIWRKTEEPLDTEEAQQLLAPLVTPVTVDTITAPLPWLTAGYFTGEWTSDGPAGMTYLGSITFDHVPDPALLDRIGQSPWRLAFTSEEDTLRVTAQPLEGHRLQMICENADPTSFMDVLQALRASYQRRKRSLILLPYFLMNALVLAFFRIDEAALSLLPVLLLALVECSEHWRLRFPVVSWKSILWMLALWGTMFLPALLNLPFGQWMDAVFACTAAAGCGLMMIVLGRQRKKRLGAMFFALVMLLATLLYAAMAGSPVATAFGAVLGCLWALPWCVMRFA